MKKKYKKIIENKDFKSWRDTLEELDKMKPVGLDYNRPPRFYRNILSGIISDKERNYSIYNGIYSHYPNENSSEYQTEIEFFDEADNNLVKKITEFYDNYYKEGKKE